ncbi:MAG: hypothetical protein HKM95_02725 [Inquilinus sp.]|nr:hypothetical protein [Inquilinus sp.]
MAPAITFCATSKSGLGHLRRLTNIGSALRARDPSLTQDLLTNAAVAGLTDAEIGLYRRIEVVERQEMAEVLRARQGGGPVLVDTAVIPGLDRLPGPLCLVLRETVASHLDRFRLEGGRPWDLIMLPNPLDEWRPDPATISARRVEAVGWIWRPPGRAQSGGNDEGPATGLSVLIASGGGGTGETARYVRGEVEPLIRSLRHSLIKPVEILQTVGPRSSAEARIDGVDRFVDVGAELHRAFARASLVVSTAGYNSVLEIACIDVPALLLAIPRSLDDQQVRARRWGDRMGHCHDPTPPRPRPAG